MNRQLQPNYSKLTRRLAPILLVGSLMCLSASSWSEVPVAQEPNQQSQKTTVQTLRAIGPALELWAADNSKGTPPSRLTPRDQNPRQFDWFGADCEVVNLEVLDEILVPKYVQSLPRVDGWDNPLEYCLDSDPATGYLSAVGVRSTGSDGVFEGNVYVVEGFSFSEFHRDIVWADGYFTTWPTTKQNRVQRTPKTLEGPGDWSLQMSDSTALYELKQTGDDSITLLSTQDSTEAMAAAVRKLDSTSLEGKRVSVTAEFRGTGLSGGYGLAISGNGVGSKFERSGPKTGQTDWESLTTELAVTSKATDLSYSFVLQGPGELEIRNILLRVD